MGCITSSAEIPQPQISENPEYSSDPEFLKIPSYTSYRIPTPHPKAKFGIKYQTEVLNSRFKYLPPYLYTLDIQQFLQVLNDCNIQGSYRHKLLKNYYQSYFQEQNNYMWCDDFRNLTVQDATSGSRTGQTSSFR